MLDGVFRLTEGAPAFQPVRAPTAAQLQALLTRLIKRLMRLLTRQGYVVEEQGMTYLANPDPETAMTPLHAAACTYRIAFGPRAGQKVLTLQTLPSQAAQLSQPGCVSEQGFSLHAEVRLAINQRHKLEHLCRYITRPAIANERLTLNGAGQVVLRLKTPYHDGTTHIVMESQGQGVALLGALRTEPLEFMQRLAALVPRPRLHLIRFHGVLAPRARPRRGLLGAPRMQRQDPHPPRLVRPATATIPSAALRAPPNRLILTPRPLPSGSDP